MEEIIKGMTDLIVRETNPRMIILFGSQARGQTSQNSDVDLLIVQDGETLQREGRWLILGRLYRLLADFHTSIDLLLYSYEEFESWRTSINHVVARALREGKVLYARS